jgi:hypothetical protein
LFTTLVRNSPRTSALVRVLYGEQASWSATEHLLASLVDLTNILLWFKTADGQKGRKRPKPVRRPGTVEAVEGVSLGGAGVPKEEFAERWARAVALQEKLKAEEKAVSDV